MQRLVKKNVMNDKKDDEIEKEVIKIKRKTTITEKKFDLLKSVQMPSQPMQAEPQTPILSAVAIYVDNKLTELDKSHRRMA